MIERAQSDQIRKDLTYFPAVGIVGPRQVGKTTLARWLQGQINKPSLYLDLEYDSDLAKLGQDNSFLEYHSDKCIILDEVQRKPELFAQLRSLIDARREPARFILLGSASPTIIRHSSESLAGRIAYTELTPFSLPELEGQVDQNTHWFRGGFPDALFAPDENLYQRWMDNFIDTFLQRDLQNLGYEIPIALMRNFLMMLTQINGNILNMSELSRSLGISQPTVAKYLDLLEGSFLINRLQPYFVNIGKRLVKSPKLYYRDTGILHRLAQIGNYGALLGNPLVGGSWESYVVEQIRRVLGPSWQYFYYRTQTGAETDLFLLGPEGQKWAIEIKFSSAPVLTKGFYQSIQDLSPTKSFVIVPSPTEKYPKAEDIWVMGLKMFLDEMK